MVLKKAHDIISFSEDGNFCDYDFSMMPKKSMSDLYRGIMFPKEWLTIGNIIHEWANGCTHWSSSKKVAVDFSENEDGNGFVYDFGEQHGANTFEECKKLFTPVVLHINTKQETYPLCEWLKVLLENGFPVDEDYMNENEYTISGYDFRILSVSKEENYYLVDVESFKSRN